MIVQSIRYVAGKLRKFRLVLANLIVCMVCGFMILQLSIDESLPSESLSSVNEYSSSNQQSNQSNKNKSTSNSGHAGYDRDQSCKFPVLDPFDSSISAYIKHPHPLFCQRVQPELTIMDGAFMTVDEALAVRHEFRNVHYRTIQRVNEKNISFGVWIKWNFTEQPKLYLHDHVEVVGQYVFEKRSKKEHEHHQNSKFPPKRYRNLHASVHVRPDRARGNSTTSARTDQERRPNMNVFIFGIDSLSRSNFIRNLPRTYDILTRSMGSTVFRGYTKIDDNTFPNILAVLTGRKVTIHGSELEGHFQHDHVDHYPFIWKNFSESGYTTGLAEEQPGVLSYKAKGFDQSPVDWYLRPFGLALDKSPLRKYSSPFCVGNRAEARIILDSMERFIIERHRSDQPYFLFSFLWKLSHDKTYDIEMIDVIVASFFRRLFNDGYFNNTLLFVMSDHGNRFDHIRRTLIGRYEERMPYLSVYAPPWFMQKHKTASENLKKNIWRLTCQFDVYETLIDALLNRFDDRDQRVPFKNRGRSLFTPIPKERTCQDAQIAQHFCVCQEEENLNNITTDKKSRNAKLVSKAVEYILHEKINKQLLGRYRSNRLCTELSLKSIESAQKYKASDQVRYAIRWHYDKLLQDRNVTAQISHLRVTFVTSPNSGVYEALVQYIDDDFEDLKQVRFGHVELSRINPYGSDGDCISMLDRTLEKFCYCRQKKSGSKSYWLPSLFNF